MTQKQIGYLVLFGASSLLVYVYLRSKKPKTSDEQALALVKEKYKAQSIQGDTSVLPFQSGAASQNPYYLQSQASNPIAQVNIDALVNTVNTSILPNLTPNLQPLPKDAKIF